jgi:hypothetical protein
MRYSLVFRLPQNGTPNFHSRSHCYYSSSPEFYISLLLTGIIIMFLRNILDKSKQTEAEVDDKGMTGKGSLLRNPFSSPGSRKEGRNE